ncbi:MAG: hypothetical protein DMD83_24925 [Candidatus Rokuibacteriota bacterium]|nr:MAG: hypothetical protein DMD83_24925 [Candidatus Rokubacteria bacterium]
MDSAMHNPEQGGLLVMRSRGAGRFEDSLVEDIGPSTPAKARIRSVRGGLRWKREPVRRPRLVQPSAGVRPRCVPKG